MTFMERVISRVRRRMFADLLLRRLAMTLPVSIAMAVLLLLVDRTTSTVVPFMSFGVLAGLGALIGLGWAWVGRPHPRDAAVCVDRQLQLKDRIGSASELPRSRFADQSMAELVLRDANRVAQNADVRIAAPIRLSNAWGVTALLILAFAACALWMPQFNLFRSDDTNDGDTALARKNNVVSTINRTVEELSIDEAQLKEEDQTDLAMLDELTKQLTGEQISPQDVQKAAEQSAVTMDRMADRMAREAEQQQAELDAVSERFKAAAGARAESSSPQAEAFRDALRDGDFDEAADTLENARRSLESMSDDEREALIEELRDIAKQLDQPRMAEDSWKELAESFLEEQDDATTLEELMRDQPSAETIEERLREWGLDEKTARDLADELNKQSQDTASDDAADAEARDIANVLDDAADEFEQDSTGAEAEEPESSESDTPSDPAQDESSSDPISKPDNTKRTTDDTPKIEREQESTDSDQPEDVGRKDGKDAKEPIETESPEGKIRPDDIESREPKDRPDKKHEPRQDMNGPDTPPSPDPDSEDSQKLPSDDGSSGDDPASQAAPKKPDGSQRVPSDGKGSSRDQSDDRSAEERALDEPGSSDGPGQQPGDESRSGSTRKPLPGQDGRTGEQDTRPGKGIDELIRKLRDLDKQSKDAVRKQRTSEQIRERAKKLADELTPDQRRQLRDWMKYQQVQDNAGGQDGKGSDSSDRLADAARAAGSPLQTEGVDDVDLRDESIGSQVLAEWLSKTADGPESAGEPTKQQRRAAIQEFRRSAEQAMEDSVIPSRYHEAVKRFFNHLPETVDRATGTAADNNAADGAANSP